MNVLVLLPYLYDTVPGQRFRIEQWPRCLEPMGVRFQFVPFESPALQQVWCAQGRYGRKLAELLRGIGRRIRDVARLDGRWDLIVIFRELLPIGPALLERWTARAGIPVVYDFDDAIFLPNVSEVHKAWGWLKWPGKTGTICRLSRHVIAGNDYLQAYARRYNERVSVIPTTIDTDAYLMKHSQAVEGVPVIGWSGSRTTVPHLRGLDQALQVLRRSAEFQLKVVGTERYALDGVEVNAHAWQAQTEAEDIQSFHIGVMPLPDDPWARGKCGLKALQYMALGVPVVASPVGVNTQIIQDGRNGLLASSAKEWVEQLSRLMRDEPLRTRLAREARATVERWYSAKAQAPCLLEIFSQLCPSARPAEASAPVMA